MAAAVPCDRKCYVSDGMATEYYYTNMSVTIAIDIRDYVNGMGNRSREQYVCIEGWPRTPCYSETDGFVELYVL